MLFFACQCGCAAADLAGTQVGDLSAAHAAGAVAPGGALRRDARGHGHALRQRRGGEDPKPSGRAVAVLGKGWKLK